MKNPTTQHITMTGPKDKSLIAYKLWMMDAIKRLTTEQSLIQLTEAEWKAFWRDFWREKYKA